MRISTLLLSSFLITTGIVALPAASHAQLNVDVSFDLFSPPPVALAPPPLPVYVVPEPPAEEYVWTPGYWRWGGDGYFWVPGTWVEPPTVGVLWTPGYWGWGGGAFAWHEGYWGPHVGFYGGVIYGGGYDGHGFNGGGWQGGHYMVNRSVTNVTNITNITNNTTNNYSSFNGGPGGTTAAPTPAEQRAAQEKHFAPTEEQRNHTTEASHDPAFQASANHGKPAVAATERAGDFTHGAVAAQQAGPKNPLARQHNAAVVQNPALAHGAALPTARPAAQSNNETATHENAVRSNPVRSNAQMAGPHASGAHPEEEQPRAQVQRDVEPRENAIRPAQPTSHMAPMRESVVRPEGEPQAQHPHAAPQPQQQPRGAKPAPAPKAEPRKEPEGPEEGGGERDRPERER